MIYTETLRKTTIIKYRVPKFLEEKVAEHHKQGDYSEIYDLLMSYDLYEEDQDIELISATLE